MSLSSMAMGGGYPRRLCGQQPRLAVDGHDGPLVAAERPRGDQGGAEPVDVEHVPDPLQRARLVGDSPSPARSTTRRRPSTSARPSRPRCWQVVRRDRRERAGAVEREPAQHDRVRAAADHDRQLARAARSRRTRRLGSVSTATTGRRTRAAAGRAGRPTWPRPTTTTWSRRGTARAAEQAGQAGVDEPVDQPAREARGADSSVSSIEATIVTLNHFGPSSTAGFGPTVASDFVEP